MARKYFGTDGIRDVAGQGLLASERVRSYGQAFGRYFSSKSPSGRVLIGRDTRGSGPAIVASLSEGLAGAGLSVVDGGVLTTPAVQTLCREDGFDFAIVVSASHNPAEDNGIKIFGADGRKRPDAGDSEIERLIEDPKAAPAAGGKPGKVEEDRAIEGRYVAFMREVCFPSLDLRQKTIILDCAHGA